MWYFGDSAGLDFRLDEVMPLGDGKMSAIEGCSVMSDATGKLLFYTNGKEVYNSQHQIMPNGSGLAGSLSSAQSSIIIPDPGNCLKYFIFTTDGQTPDSNGNGNWPNDSIFAYSVVDLSLDNGLGDIPEKNIPLLKPVNERLCAVLHENGRDTWVLTRKFFTNQYYAYLVTSQGINPPVISQVGPIPTTDGIFRITSYMKFSPDGTKLALGRVGVGDDVEMHLFNFDTQSGIVSNFISLGPNSGRYGLSFSPNSQYLYTPSTKFDVSNFNQKEIIQSKILIIPSDTDVGQGSALQIGPDGKIYIAKSYFGSSRYVGIINSPNSPGVNIEYYSQGIFLENNLSGSGLPNFIESFFDSKQNNFPANSVVTNPANDLILCYGETDTIGIIPTQGYNYLWQPSFFVSDPIISNPIITNFNQSNKIDTINYRLIAAKGSCKSFDTIQVLMLPEIRVSILGSRSVCPFVEEVDYWADNPHGYEIDWEVNGGSIVSGLLTDSIKVNWGPTSNTAYIKATPKSILKPGCSGISDTLDVLINVELQTETPRGDTTVCSNLVDGNIYNIINTNGSTYNWGVSGGAIVSGQGTNEVSVNWIGEGLQKIWVEEESITSDTICFGVSDTLSVLVFMDTTGIDINYISTNFDDETAIMLDWGIRDSINVNNDILIIRRDNNSGTWTIISNEDKTTNFFEDLDLNTDETIYQYKLQIASACDLIKESIQHESMLLNVIGSEDSDRILLSWNDYSGWSNGVDRYEVWRKVDGSSWEILTKTSVTTLVTETAREGFRHQFRIKAQEQNGNGFSWSNIQEIEYKHDIFIPNVFTPNGDGKNDVFLINKLEIFPNNELRVFNRYGKEVHFVENYKNLWDGEKLPDGIYYYYLILKDNKSEFKGYVQILR